MAIRAAILGLVLLTGYNTLGWRMKVAPGGPLTEEKGTTDLPLLRCTVSTQEVSWRAADVAATVYVEFEVREASELSVTPSLHLIALPKTAGLSQKEYWAPFALATGASTKVIQKLSPCAGRKLSVRVIPSRLLWASTISSVWPSKSFGSGVPPGRYALEVQIELSGGQIIHSNEITIRVAK